MPLPPHLRKPARKKTHEDKRHAETVEAAKQGVIEQLKRFIEGNRDRKIRELTPMELELVATGAVSAWVRKRAELSIEEMNDDLDDLYPDPLG